MRNNTETIVSKNKKMIAHRGVSGLETENTLAAFIAAGNRTYYGIECDIHRTADGRYVVIRDAETGRVASDNLNVERNSFSLVRSVILNDKDGSKRKDLFIPEYREYLTVCKKYNKISVVELKGVFAVEWIREVVEITRKAEQLENAVFIAFDAENLLALRKLLPKQPLQLLTCEWRDDLPDFLAKNHFGLDIAYNQLTEERISACHTKGVQVNCWTVDDKSAAEALYAMGVDYITSNILE